MKEIELIKEKLPQIEKQGFIPTMRKGNTGSDTLSNACLILKRTMILAPI